MENSEKKTKHSEGRRAIPEQPRLVLALQQKPTHPIPNTPQVIPEQPYFLAYQALPYVYKPYSARILKPVGNGFWLLIALGIEDPARTIEARRASSTPYDCLL